MNVFLKKKHEKIVKKTKKDLVKLNKKIDEKYDNLLKELKIKKFSKDENWLFDYIMNGGDEENIIYK